MIAYGRVILLALALIAIAFALAWVLARLDATALLVCGVRTLPVTCGSSTWR